MALELSNIKIINYKSINEVELNINKYDNSYTTVLVGKNETGKSNLLNSIAFIDTPDIDYSYEELRNSQNDTAKYVDFYYTYKFSTPSEWKEILEQNIKVPTEILEKIIITGVENNTYLSNEKTKFTSCSTILFEELNEEFLNNYSFIQLNNSNEEEHSFKYEIVLTKSIKQIIDVNASETSKPNNNYKTLNNDNLSSILDEIFTETIDNNKLKVSRWKYSKEFLITETINLKEFKDNPNICFPLRNIFTLAGYKTIDDISQKIDSLVDSPKSINKLATQLEKTATDYINKIWAESKIKVKVSIQKDLSLDVYIIDEADEDNTYYMSDRSEGFKQFVSLILSISAANETDRLKNNIILIDEPEIHMHPSGIRFMRNELLRIGENNYVFLATHSQFMIDTKNKERHYIVTKPDNNTCIKVWDSTKDLADDEILRQAFGINVLNDLLAPNRILVEGYSDCIIFEKALSIIYPNRCITITNGTGSNIVSVASMLKMYNVDVLTIVDADKDGMGYKREIVKLGKPFETSSVKTIRDINSDIIDCGTIEDCLDSNYVVKQLKMAFCNVMERKTCSFTYKEEKPILEEFKIFLAQNSITKNDSQDIVEQAKILIAQNFNPNTSSLRNKNSKLLEICNKIIEYFTPMT